MPKISTHVLDLARGLPAAGIKVQLDHDRGGTFARVGEGVTDAEGRIKAFTASHVGAMAGRYRLTFILAPYFGIHGVPCFFPEASVIFDVRDPADQHHVPLLLSPFGYSTYRGS